MLSTINILEDVHSIIPIDPGNPFWDNDETPHPWHWDMPTYRTYSSISVDVWMCYAKYKPDSSQTYAKLIFKEIVIMILFMNIGMIREIRIKILMVIQFIQKLFVLKIKEKRKIVLMLQIVLNPFLQKLVQRVIVLKYHQMQYIKH